MTRRRLAPTVVGIATAIITTGIVVADLTPAAAEGLGTITVVAQPSEAVERTLQVGDTQVSEAVEFTARLASDGSVGVTVDPDDVPASAVDSDGGVTLHIQRVDTQGLVGTTTLSLQRDPANDEQWIDPTDDGEAGNARHRARSFRTFRVKFSMRKAQGLKQTKSGRFTTVPGDDQDPPGTAPDWQEYIGDPEFAEVDPDLRGVESCTLHARSWVWATIATSYPIENNRSWLEYSSSISTVSGTAATMGLQGSFRKEGTKSVQDNWGQDFEPSPYNRSYRAQTDYGLYNCVNTITGFRWWKTEPRFQTGGTEAIWLDPADRPGWGTCAPVANGVWYRGTTRGEDYTLSYGVKIKDLIGFDLSTQHRYSTAGRLNYSITGQPKRMCGNAGDVPAQAAKLIERYR